MAEVNTHDELLAAFNQGKRITAQAPATADLPMFEFDVYRVDKEFVYVRFGWGGRAQLKANALGLRYVVADVRQELPSRLKVRQHLPEQSGWIRTEFTSVWKGEALEMIVVQCSGSSEAWKWTARGWREPSEADGADTEGWVEASTRKIAEQAALKWYMAKDE